MSFFAELNRRNVTRVGIAYIVIGWILAQVAEFAFENFGAPEWVLKTFVFVLLLGLPLALFFAWAFELTPEGVKREKDVDRSQSITPLTSRKLDFVIIGALVVALGYFVWERQAGVETSGSVGQASVTDVEPVLDSGPSVRSIAVLPFVNMSSDAEQEWFSDGLTEEILNALARTPDLLVAARTSSFMFKDSNEDIQTIANALGVAHILEGSVRRGRDRLRVTAQLIRASDGFHLWSQTYDRNPEDVISIQEDVAIEIATALKTAIDPEALENMVSAGTNSVEAYNAYLRGMAFDASTLNTGDTYVFLSARDAFERAVELDSTFVFAYWELALFWRVQLQTTNIVSGIVEMPAEEMMARFDDAINNAIEHERDPVNKIRFRAYRDYEHLRFGESLRLITDYLKQRPNDRDAQNLQLLLLAAISRDDELFVAIADFQGRDGYDIAIANNSMTASLISGDNDYIREIANVEMKRAGDSVFVVYQAHRSALWTGDIDGASQLLSILRSSDLPETSRLLVELRQACAENRLSDAAQTYDRLMSGFADETSVIWLGHRIMNQNEKAMETLMELDRSKDLRSLSGFLLYAHFDPRPFPNLMAMLEAQGVEPREPRDIPYQCKL
jgi:TolB-like protein